MVKSLLLNPAMANPQLVDESDKRDIEHISMRGETRDAPQQMKSSMDKVPVFTALVKYRRISLWAMLAAFSASLDGYRK